MFDERKIALSLNECIGLLATTEPTWRSVGKTQADSRE
jgi:hypothetical protein